ncbi:MAG TPA: ABC transporter permease [Thermoanaerobaculia bacterium]|nr:ABC transporter permease [Thermoanaerobaculia bacterium]
MRGERIVTIARREYLAGVRTKAFWISTALLPLLMAAMLVLPSLVLMKTRATLRVAVVDESGRVFDRLAAELGEESAGGTGPSSAREREVAARFEIERRQPSGDADAQRAALDREVLDGAVDAWIWISPAAFEGARVPYHAESVSNFVTQKILSAALTRAVSAARLEGAGIDVAAVERLTGSVDLETVRVSAEGARREAGFAGFALAYALFFLLYLVTILYGQQVMNGVLEEKTSRIVEVVLATARPVELLAGKLFGIAAVGLTQLAIWFAALLALTAPGAIQVFAALPEDVALPSLSLAVVAHFFAHFLLGFFLFASLYAAVGAASSDPKEAQQLAAFVVVFVVAPVMLMFSVINDPDSTLAVVVSLLPPFTPLLMLLRIVVKTPPVWQIALGYLLTSAFIAGLLWACGKIYRVGILMHGKRPTLAELGRWIRHS